MEHPNQFGGRAMSSHFSVRPIGTGGVQNQGAHPRMLSHDLDYMMVDGNNNNNPARLTREINRVNSINEDPLLVYK